MSVDAVSIIGGGWSFGEVDHKKVPGHVIGVNDALIYFQGERPLDEIVSMDRLWTEHRWMALENQKVQTYLRQSTLKNVPWQSDQRYTDWLHTYACRTEERLLSADPAVMNGRNSGAVSLNRAFLLRPQTLYLFGFDMSVSPAGVAHWHPPYPWGKGPQGNTGKKSYENWSSDFDSYATQFALNGTKVINVSPHSQIKAFPKLSAKEVGCAR